MYWLVDAWFDWLIGCGADEFKNQFSLQKIRRIKLQNSIDQGEKNSGETRQIIRRNRRGGTPHVPSNCRFVRCSKMFPTQELSILGQFFHWLLLSSSFRTLKPELVFGINEVTKGLEKDALSLVIVDRSTKPFSMISHIPMLAASRQTPAVAIEELSAVLAKKIGVGSLVALGFKVSSATPIIFHVDFFHHWSNFFHHW